MSVRSATEPASTLTGARRATLRGFTHMTSTRRCQLILPEATRCVSMSGRLVSRPTTPNGAISNSHSFSWRACGAWSVTMQSIVPSTMPARSAAASSAVRRGGFILRFVSYVSSSADSSRNRWCGHTSAVTGRPSALAARTSSMPWAVEMWQICRAQPVRRHSSMSRAISISSPAAGQPARPRRVLARPSFTMPCSVSERTSQWQATARSNWRT